MVTKKSNSERDSMMKKYFQALLNVYRPRSTSDWTPIAVTLSGLVLVGLVAVGAAGAAIPQASCGESLCVWRARLLAALTVTLLAGAALLVGGTLGFLFALPRNLDEAQRQNGGKSGKPVAYRANTNLEQISDWLTKILVGVSLTQLPAIPYALWQAAEYLVDCVPGAPCDKRIVAVYFLAIVYFTTSGFLFAYLWSRVFLAAVFHRADERVGEKKTRKLRESYIQAHLYEYADSGFEKAIEELSEYFVDFGRGGNPWMLVYSACAWGQKYRWLVENKGADEDKKKAREKCLQEVSMALTLRPDYRPVFQRLLNPSPAEAQDGDNDLAAFRGDPDFVSLIENAPSSDPGSVG